MKMTRGMSHHSHRPALICLKLLTSGLSYEKAAARSPGGGFAVFGGQLQKQNGRHRWRPFVRNSDHREKKNSSSLAGLAATYSSKS
jgi:hypothetical protein